MIAAWESREVYNLLWLPVGKPLLFKTRKYSSNFILCMDLTYCSFNNIVSVFYFVIAIANVCINIKRGYSSLYVYIAYIVIYTMP